MRTEIRINRVDESGVYALPYGITADQLGEVLLDGKATEYAFVKSGTEIDVPLARTDSVVAIVLQE